MLTSAYGIVFRFMEDAVALIWNPQNFFMKNGNFVVDKRRDLCYYIDRERENENSSEETAGFQYRKMGGGTIGSS